MEELRKALARVESLKNSSDKELRNLGNTDIVKMLFVSNILVLYICVIQTIRWVMGH